MVMTWYGLGETTVRVQSVPEESALAGEDRATIDNAKIATITNVKNFFVLFTSLESEASGAGFGPFLEWFYVHIVYSKRQASSPTVQTAHTNRVSIFPK